MSERTRRGGQADGSLSAGEKRVLALLGLPTFGLALAIGTVTTYGPLLALLGLASSLPVLALLGPRT